ncbi:MAG: hypothetical protein WC785_05935 [Tatlockia sp.]|jgi:acyl-coenzyme A thioesterase PaaI-like protein
MKLSTHFRFFLWTFGRFKVPLIGYLKPKIIRLDDKELVIKIPLSRRSKNHLHSMYFGALAVGADLAGGLHGFYHAKQAKVTISLLFKSFQAEFYRRPESDVYFVCNSGAIIQAMIKESKQTKQRINKPIEVQGMVNYPEKPEQIARFTLELSIKVV